MVDYDFLLKRIDELEQKVQQLNENVHRLTWPMLCYVPGSGGNWLRRILMREPLQPGGNFHRDQLGRLGRFHADPVPAGNRMIPGVDLVHNYNMKHDFFFSGNCYFNFYLNKLYKFDQVENNFFDRFDHTEWVNKCLQTARWVLEFDRYIDQCNINFVDLVLSPDNFLQQIDKISDRIIVDRLTMEEFLPLRDRFLETCVNPETVYENWDNMFWVMFVVAELEMRGVHPGDFSIGDPAEVSKLIEFAKANRHLCTLTNVVAIDSNVYMPEWPITVDKV